MNQFSDPYYEGYLAAKVNARSPFDMIEELCESQQWFAGYETALMELPIEEFLIHTDNGASIEVFGLYNPARDNQYEIYSKKQDVKIVPLAAGDCRDDAIDDYLCWYEQQYEIDKEFYDVVPSKAKAKFKPMGPTSFTFNFHNSDNQEIMVFLHDQIQDIYQSKKLKKKKKS
ncbi:MAG: hypothetical protein DWQ19_09600 [Crenarchaeota archaeon]|nr:MAG: hypothetical protein DWQ19_09600 [Thermoproteota archaeon]